MDFDKARWKLAEDLTPEEVELVVANKDKLNDEEKAAFSELLQAAEPFADDPNEVLDNEIGKAVEEPENQEPEAQPVAPAVQAAPTVPQTQEQLDAYLEQKKQQWDKEGKTQQEQTKETEKIEAFFDAGYKPADWNEYTQAMFDKIAPLIEKRVIDRLEKQNQEFTDNQTKLKQSQQEIYERFEAEFATLSKNSLIPDPTKEPENYQKVHDAIIKIGDENGKTNVTDAYKLWSIIPEQHGGGLVVDSPKSKIEAQRQAAGKIGSAKGAPAAAKSSVPTWHSIHSTSMDDLLDQALAR